MPHEINDGRDFVAVVNENREEPWHRLGQRVDRAMTAKQALRLANLDWDVSLQPVFAVNPFDEDEALVLDGRWATVRSIPGRPKEAEILGVVGSQYTVVQNREVFDFMDLVVDRVGGAHFDTAGFLRPPREDGTLGAQVFLTIDLADTGMVVLDPKGARDTLETKLACCTSHDGSLAITPMLTTVRIVCHNTQDLALHGAKRKWRIKHTRNVADRLEAAREAITNSLKYAEEMGKLGQRLITQAYVDREFERLIRQVFPLPRDPTERQTRLMDTTYDTLRWLFREGPTNENIRGTKWCALQSVGEYLDWYVPVRNAKGSEDMKRAVNTVMDLTVPRKQRALSLLVGAR